MQPTTQRVSLLLLAVLLVGCEISRDNNSTPSITTDKLIAENERLTSQLAQQRRQTEQLSQQLDTLSGFPDGLSHLVRVADVEFGRFTRGYDQDNDGLDDGVNVYFILRDSAGDSIKAAGRIEIELWDLAAPEDSRLFGRWNYDLDQLNDYWLAGLMAYHYKFALAWPQGAPPDHPNLTIKLKYSDALTGLVFERQKMVEIILPARPAR